jgi:hypothetical protein
MPALRVYDRVLYEGRIWHAASLGRDDYDREGPKEPSLRSSVRFGIAAAVEWPSRAREPGRTSRGSISSMYTIT